MEEKQKITPEKMQKRLESALQFKQNFGLHEKWRKNERFKCGEQWGAIKPGTEALPRPVFNIIDHIINFKKSSVMNENVNMVYSYLDGFPSEDEKDFATILSRYSETLWEEVEQDKLNSRALDQAALTGIGLIHYYWDSSYSGGKALKYTGRIKGEVLNPINVYFGNPQNIELQEQPWIIIVNRISVDNIKAMAKESGIPKKDIDLIKEEPIDINQVNNTGNTEVSENKKATLITMYYKENGRVFFTRSCGDVMVTEPTDTEFEMYPILMINWKERFDFIYGSSEVEGIIPNQKAINLLIALQMMNVQLTGFPRLVYKKGAIDPSKVTNRIGEMIEDKSQMPGFQAQYLNAGQVSPLAGDLTQRFIDYTKDLSGANDNATGETNSENATAIMLLQKSAGTVVETIRKNFYRSLHDLGLIWLEFFKHRFNTIRVLSILDVDNTQQFVPFDSSMIEEAQFKLKINIGVSSAYAETFTTTALDKFLQGGYITFEQYLKYSPKNTVPFKDSLLREIEKQKEQEMEQEEQQLLSEQPPEIQQQYAMLPEEEKKVFMLALAKNKEQSLMGTDMGGGGAMASEDPRADGVVSTAEAQKFNDEKYKQMLNGEGMKRPIAPNQ